MLEAAEEIPFTEGTTYAFNMGLGLSMQNARKSSGIVDAEMQISNGLF